MGGRICWQCEDLRAQLAAVTEERDQARLELKQARCVIDRSGRGLAAARQALSEFPPDFDLCFEALAAVDDGLEAIDGGPEWFEAETRRLSGELTEAAEARDRWHRIADDRAAGMVRVVEERDQARAECERLAKRAGEWHRELLLTGAIWWRARAALWKRAAKEYRASFLLWRAKWECLETNRASCCWDNEKRATAAESTVAELRRVLSEDVLPALVAADNDPCGAVACERVIAALATVRAVLGKETP